MLIGFFDDFVGGDKWYFCICGLWIYVIWCCVVICFVLFILCFSFRVVVFSLFFWYFKMWVFFLLIGIGCVKFSYYKVLMFVV